MDFGELLHYAKKNTDASTKDGNKFYSTKYAPPKKESKESKQLSQNIQKFLKKREAEEQERKQEERQKLANLLALRDEKSKNKIRKMLKVTKSANKSVLDDAKDGGQNGVAANDQGEGDDYGYVSNEANALYQKYLEKVKNVQEDKGFAPVRPQTLSDLSGTKERVKAAITRERDEAMSHTRQRSSTTSSSSAPKKECTVARAYNTSKTLYDPEAERREEERKKREEEQKKAKPKRAQQPPPMDFQALLRLAEKKQHEPVVFVASEKKKEPERLLSAREKKEQEERQRQREERARRDRDRARGIEPKAKEPRKEATSGGGQRMEANGRIPKLNSAAASKPQATATTKDTATANESKAKQTSDSLKRAGAAASKTATSTSSRPTNSSMPAGSKAASLTNTKAPATASSGNTPKASVSNGSASKQQRNPYAMANKNATTREFPPRSSSATSAAAGKTRQFPPPDVQRAGSRPLPQAGVRGGGAATSYNRKPAEPVHQKRIYDDDDEDYDSELDDFIDDGDCEEDISSHIRDIFGYDKRKYRHLDDDDRGMESSFAQMQREEYISKKLGLQEDLEDMRMEAAHKKRKIAKKRSRGLDDDED